MRSCRSPVSQAAGRLAETVGSLQGPPSGIRHPAFDAREIGASDAERKVSTYCLACPHRAGDDACRGRTRRELRRLQQARRSATRAMAHASSSTTWTAWPVRPNGGVNRSLDGIGDWLMFIMQGSLGLKWEGHLLHCNMKKCRSGFP